MSKHKETKRRKILATIYNQLYSHVPVTISPEGFRECFYCGDPASTLDHQPALSSIEAYRALSLEQEHYLKVACCKECNSLLGNVLSLDLIERELQAAHLLKRRYRKVYDFPEWTKEELTDMSPSFRKSINARVAQREYIESRVDFSGGVNRYLVYTREIDEKEDSDQGT